MQHKTKPTLEHAIMPNATYSNDICNDAKTNLQHPYTNNHCNISHMCVCGSKHISPLQHVDTMQNKNHKTIGSKSNLYTQKLLWHVSQVFPAKYLSY